MLLATLSEVFITAFSMLLLCAVLCVFLYRSVTKYRGPAVRFWGDRISGTVLVEVSHSQDTKNTPADRGV